MNSTKPSCRKLVEVKNLTDLGELNKLFDKYYIEEFLPKHSNISLNQKPLEFYTETNIKGFNIFNDLYRMICFFGHGAGEVDNKNPYLPRCQVPYRMLPLDYSANNPNFLYLIDEHGDPLVYRLSKGYQVYFTRLNGEYYPIKKCGEKYVFANGPIRYVDKMCFYVDKHYKVIKYTFDLLEMQGGEHYYTAKFAFPKGYEQVIYDELGTPPYAKDTEIVTYNRNTFSIKDFLYGLPEARKLENLVSHYIVKKTLKDQDTTSQKPYNTIYTMTSVSRNGYAIYFVPVEVNDLLDADANTKAKAYASLQTNVATLIDTILEYTERETKFLQESLNDPRSKALKYTFMRWFWNYHRDLLTKEGKEKEEIKKKPVTDYEITFSYYDFQRQVFDLAVINQIKEYIDLLSMFTIPCDIYDYSLVIRQGKLYFPTYKSKQYGGSLYYDPRNYEKFVLKTEEEQKDTILKAYKVWQKSFNKDEKEDFFIEFLQFTYGLMIDIGKSECFFSRRNIQFVFKNKGLIPDIPDIQTLKYLFSEKRCDLIDYNPHTSQNGGSALFESLYNYVKKHTSARIKYKNRSYIIREGKRGGKYILYKGKKLYLDVL